jgi:lipid II:glycine glycyltransferase (peptidoglycan interpeptide bridge formation enzyme)
MNNAETKLVRVVSPAPRDVWLQVLESDPMAFIYQTPVGLDALCAQGRLEDASRMYEFGDGRQIILPLFRKKGLPQWLSVERSTTIGSLVSPGPVRPDELQAIFADLDARPVFRTIISPTSLTGDAWAQVAPAGVGRVHRRGHVLDLEGGFETVWEKRFNGQARRAVRKALKSDIEVESDRGARLMPVLYELLGQSVDRWARQRHEPRLTARLRARLSQPRHALEAIAETLGDHCRMWVARVDGKPAAAIVVLQGSNAHYTRGAMDMELAGPTRASFLLQKLAIEAACDAGCRYYNMGETGASEGLARFKSHFGAKAYDFSEYYIERLPILRIEKGARSLAKKALSLRGSRNDG